MGTIIADRRGYSDERFKNLEEELSQAENICAEKACVYATGSFGRREASTHSDCDLFIVSLGTDKKDSKWLSKLEEIELKAELIRSTRKLSLPPFSRDGEFLQHHTSQTLIATTGTDKDDATNTFTARLLLLLESRSLIGSNVHSMVIDDVIAKYWREFPDHAENFMPAYLANDILRYWRTLCLNYEARTSEETLRDRAKRKLTNYKLKHSRMLTCYSALLYLLSVYVKNDTVTVADARKLVYLTPTERIELILGDSGNDAIRDTAKLLLDQYEKFLSVTSASEEDLISLFSDNDEAHKLRDEQSRFGELVYQLLHLIGEGNRFYRRLVV